MVFFIFYGPRVINVDQTPACMYFCKERYVHRNSWLIAKLRIIVLVSSGVALSTGRRDGSPRHYNFRGTKFIYFATYMYVYIPIKKWKMLVAEKIIGTMQSQLINDVTKWNIK